MLKKNFLNKLESKLSTVSKKKVSQIIKKYERIIDDEVESGRNEEDVIASLGNVDVIAKLYTKNAKQQKNSKNTETQYEKVEVNGVIETAIKKFFDYIEDLFQKVTEEEAKRILFLLCLVAVGMLSLAIIHIPFRIIDIIGIGIFNLLFDNYCFCRTITIIWSIIINMTYVILSIWLIIKYIDQIVYYYLGKQKNHRDDNESKDDELNDDELKDDEPKATKKMEKHESRAVSSDSPYYPLYLVLKVFIILLTIPLCMVEAGLLVALFFSIALLTTGVALYGPVFIIIGLIFIVAAWLDLIYSSLCKGGLK